MINLGLYLENNDGKRAFVGDEIKLDLLVQGLANKDETYRITDIRADGTVIFDGFIGQHISGINNFRVVNKRRV